MGIKRLLKKTLMGGGNPVYGHVFDAFVKKQKTGKPIKECLKDSFNETIQEDMPITSHIYKEGKKDGRIQGTIEQANRDEEKFRKLAEQHDSDRRNLKNQIKEYEDLLDDVEAEFKQR